MWLIVLLVLSVVFIIISTVTLKLHPFLALLIAAFGFGIFCGKMPLDMVVKSLNEGFGGTVGAIGIVILAGSVIGTFLEKSGGAFRLAEGTLRLVGQRNVPLAMGIIGYIVSIPVFCDSGFVILSPLSKALSWKARISLAGSAVALSLGLYATHTMVPPTPGPVAAAGILKADLGLVILWGMLVGAVALTTGWLFAVRFAAKTYIDPEPELRQAAPDATVPDGPSAVKSLAPILLPIVLIVGKSVGDLPSHPLGVGGAARLVGFLGQPVVALLLGVLLAFLLPQRLTRQMVSPSGWVGEAVVTAATIIIITGCGGAFGKVLQNSGIQDGVAHHLGGRGLGIWLPFIIAAALKTAQGSSTVAIITTASILSPMLPAIGCDSATGKALAVVAIGAGSMVVSHANDSYFWVVTQFSRMNVKEGYRLQTLGTLVQGVAAGMTVWAIHRVVV